MLIALQRTPGTSLFVEPNHGFTVAYWIFLPGWGLTRLRPTRSHWFLSCVFSSAGTCCYLAGMILDMFWLYIIFCYRQCDDHHQKGIRGKHTPGLWFFVSPVPVARNRVNHMSQNLETFGHQAGSVLKMSRMVRTWGWVEHGVPQNELLVSFG